MTYLWMLSCNCYVWLYNIGTCCCVVFKLTDVMIARQYTDIITTNIYHGTIIIIIHIQ